jgi:hypothetical protein
LCEGVSRVLINGPFDEPYVSDVIFEDQSGIASDSINPGAKVDLRNISIALAGCSVVVSLSSARLELLKEQEREEDWIGPLTSS